MISRADLVAVLTRIYFAPAETRKASLAEEMADAVLALLEKHK